MFLRRVDVGRRGAIARHHRQSETASGEHDMKRLHLNLRMDALR
jgi:hypothetical protein